MRDPGAHAQNGQASRRSCGLSKNVIVIRVGLPLGEKGTGGIERDQSEGEEKERERVVLGAPLTIDADSFKTASGNLEDSLRLICEKVHAYGDIAIGGQK